MGNFTCKTVAVKADNDQGYKIINESDLGPDDILVGEDAKKADKKTPKQAKPKSKKEAEPTKAAAAAKGD